MFAWFNSDAREVRALNKDARTIVEMARQTYRGEIQRDIAVLIGERLEHARARCGDDEACVKDEVERLQALHREARQRHDPVGLTAYTLVIIHLRSRRLGEACDPARDAVDGYVEEWDPAGPDQGALGA